MIAGLHSLVPTTGPLLLHEQFALGNKLRLGVTRASVPDIKTMNDKSKIFIGRTVLFL